jgi:hypothetical protein
MKEPIYPTRGPFEDWEDYQETLDDYYIAKERWEEYWDHKELTYEDELLFPRQSGILHRGTGFNQPE